MSRTQIHNTFEVLFIRALRALRGKSFFSRTSEVYHGVERNGVEYYRLGMPGMLIT